MGPLLVCGARPDDLTVRDLEEPRRNRIRDLILRSQKADGVLLPQDFAVPPSLDYNLSQNPCSISSRFSLLHLDTGRAPVCSVRLIHFSILDHMHFLNPTRRKKIETDLDYLRHSVPFLSAEDLECLEVEADVTPGSYAQVQMVTFHGKLAIRKVMLSNCFLKLLLREARILLELNGAGGAPQVLAVCTDPPAVVLEFVGNTLTEFLSECRSISLLLDTVAKVCDRVHEVHRKGFVHCDLKANNITVSGELHNLDVHIIDFGLATPIGQAFDSESAGIDFQNKREYLRLWMSPEMKAGRPLHASSDVYSLGVLVIKMAVIANDSWLTSAITPLAMGCTHPDPGKRPHVPDVAAFLRGLKDKQL